MKIINSGLNVYFGNIYNYWVCPSSALVRPPHGAVLAPPLVTAMSEDEIATHEIILKQKNISRSCYHGGAFGGNAMRKITLMANEIGFPINFLIPLKRFSEVVKACFRQKIEGDYKLAIFQFEEAYRLTGLNCSTKVHIYSV